MAERNPTLKLLVDTDNSRVLFAEAGKDVVDFLFSFLALPVGAAASLLAAEGMAGSVGELYGSVQRLDGTYLQAGFDKNLLLKPAISSNTSCRDTFLLECSQSPSTKKFYKCDGNYAQKYYNSASCSSYVTDGTGVPCPNCRGSMAAQMTYVSPTQAMVASDVGGGYVKGVITYMVMDDLVVQPMSTISCITLLNKFHIKDVGSLEERTVNLGMEEGLRLLKASFQSKTVLTDVFLGRRIT